MKMEVIKIVLGFGRVCNELASLRIKGGPIRFDFKLSHASNDV